MSETEECRCQRKDAPPLDHWSGCPVWKKFFADKPAPVEKSEGPYKVNELDELTGPGSQNLPEKIWYTRRNLETIANVAFAEGQKSERVKLESAVNLLRKIHSERCSCPTKDYQATCWLMYEIRTLEAK